MLLIALFAIDDHQDPPIDVQMRNTLMSIFVRDISDSGLDDIEQYASDVCGWQGVTCAGHDIVQIRMRDKKYGNFALDMLPSTLRQLEIVMCKQKYPLNIRCLPGGLVSFSVFGNQMFGRLDLTILPRHLEEATFHRNRFNGPIVLLNLPSNLKYLDVMNNAIVQDTLWYDHIPENLKKIWLIKGSSVGLHEKNRIKKVRPAYSGVSMAEKVTFVGVRQEKVF
uniref:Leucine-rich repeat-containing N-terminal plant-type domain-containing protein n=1 Tax=Paramoeba aestuarina TaxID=180227 RepID=A0A7S4PFC5_9EUKA|mmetsp:Transcript_5388/g.8130  ORF Transcript_5388/g.8130 Transcript_5388/m.8130 type:complete len:223 (+) Transcript_5388:27-695(+)